MPRRIAIVGPPLSAHFGGQEVQADALAAHWREDAEVSAAFVANRPAFPEGLNPLNRVPYLRSLIRLPMYVMTLFRALGGVDLVHIFAGSFGTFLLATAPAFAIARLRGKIVLVHYHSGRGGEHLRRSAIARYILRASAAVVVPSEYLAAPFRTYGIHAAVVANVVDANQFRYRSRERLTPNLLCTRNLQAQYGIDLVVRAFARVLKEFPEATLTLAGSGPQENEIRKLAGELAPGRVRMLGGIPPREMPAIYDQSDVFVNASYVDCAPVSIVEAFCSGLPVVTTATGGIASLVEHGETAWTCAPGDWQGLAEGILGLLRDPQMAQSMAARARRQAELSSWEDLRTAWIAAYLAAEQRAGHRLR